IEADAEALALIASAAEGSSRDGLSILDQAIAHADMDTDGRVTAERVRDMLGLADKSALRRLYASLLEGDAPAMLAEVDRQYAYGVEPLALMRSLMELTHRVAVTQIGGAGADAPTPEERRDIEGWAARLSAGQVHRLWQLLLKGHEEVRGAPDPLVSAQMALLRVLHAADLPDPGTLAKQLGELASSAATAPPVANGSAPAPTPVATIDWAELCDQVDRAGMLRVASLMRDWVRVIELAPGQLAFSLAPGLNDDPAAEIRDALLKATGERWQVERGTADGVPSLREQAEGQKAAEAQRIRKLPLVEAAFAAFPDAEFAASDDAPAGDRNWSKRA
ncbi:MAG: DNA polymerase III subunit gamma/tau, partial [Croceibacterium sp.]